MAGVTTTVSLHLDYAAISRMLKSATGPVGRHIVNIGVATQQKAQATAPVKTGLMKRSIIMTANQMAMGTEVEVTINVPYGLAIHEGAAPHEIRPNQASVLRFPSRSGFIVYAPSVNHPGNKANPFLWEALVDAVR